MLKLLKLILKNMGRNKVRTILTSLAIFFLVAVFTSIATILTFLEDQMKDQEADVMAIITERYRIPSRFDVKYMDDIASSGSSINNKLTSGVPNFQGQKTNIWHFIVFSLDPQLKDKDGFFFCIATNPEKIASMTDGMPKDWDKDGKIVKAIKSPPKSGIDNIGVVLGTERLAKLKKQVGDVFTVTALSHRGQDGKFIEIPVEVVGELTGDRWAQGGFMDYEYLNRVLKAVKSDLDGKVNLGWLMVNDQKAAATSAGIIETELPDVKCETLSAAVGRFLDSFKDILFGVKFLLVPAIFLVMTTIVANAISITVRERRMEIAVLKVLGYSSTQIMLLILGEGLLIGVLAGTASSWLTYYGINVGLGGIKFPIGFFPKFMIPDAALWWGPAAGAVTSFLGSIFPAMGAKKVKVVDVFSRVA